MGMLDDFVMLVGDAEVVTDVGALVAVQCVERRRRVKQRIDSTERLCVRLCARDVTIASEAWSRHQLQEDGRDILVDTGLICGSVTRMAHFRAFAVVLLTRQSRSEQRRWPLVPGRV